jgi:hypothetical protein
VSDIDTVVVDSLKSLDPKRPIREGDIARFEMKEAANYGGLPLREHTFFDYCGIPSTA